MAEDAGPGRPNQRRRTRKDLLDAAGRLMRDGRKPSLEEVAAEALVSRATAYRYFPSIEALLLEASLHVAAPDPAEVFRGAPADDAAARVARVETAFQDMILANEAPLRLMLAQSLERAALAAGEAEAPRRQNRRSPLIAQALEPARASFDPAALDLLEQALAIVIGTEGFIVTRDVLQLDDAAARRVKLWAIRALLAAAAKP